MSDRSVQEPVEKRRRIQKLKRYIIVLMTFGITVPFMLCFILAAQIRQLNRENAGLERQLERLSGLLQEQQAQLDGLSEELSVIGREKETAEEPEQEASGQAQEPFPSGPEEEEDGETPEITAAHKVYLTFDDGPSIYTDDILDILDDYGVKATFFVVGKETDSAKEALQDIVDRGHTLGMHSYSHKYSDVYRSVDDFAEDFTKLQDYLYDVTGVKSNVYRFPGGSSNTVSRLDMHEFADYLAEQEVRFFDWNISSGDGGRALLSVETLVKNCTEDIEKHGTSVILMHDSASKSTTVDALPTIIENILAMEDTVILPITDDTEPVQHIH
ncbi:MAG: polysaccharide deacetylase family protein [bacterium]|nr:polysaccharide deacetylase family protein [bacterium]